MTTPKGEGAFAPALHHQNLEDDDLRDLDLALAREEAYAAAFAAEIPAPLDKTRALAQRVLGRRETDYTVKTFPGLPDDAHFADLHQHKLELYYRHRNEMCRDRYADEAKAKGRTVRQYTRLGDLTPEERADHRRAQKAASKQRKRTEGRATA